MTIIRGRKVTNMSQIICQFYTNGKAFIVNLLIIIVVAVDSLNFPSDFITTLVEKFLSKLKIMARN